MLSGPQCFYFMLYSVSSIALEHQRHLLLENEPKMENWISVLLFLSLPIFNSAGSFLDTSCITHNPTGNTSYDTTFIGVVVYNGRDTARSYRRAATTKRFDSYNNYPTLGNTSCTISTVGDRDASRSCGFYSYIHIISQFEREPLINGDEVVLRRSNSKAPVQDNLRFGVFQCIASQQEHRFISTVTIMPEEADFKPPAFTITANLDERVTLEMLASDSSTPTEQVRWRYSWGSVTRELSEWEGNTTPVIEKVKTSDAGVYEAYTTSSTDSGYVRLTVRGCRYNLWGSPSCQWTCPVCYNGGICDDVSGGCVCPPGFTGSQCEQACPSGYIGRRCGISCATVIGVADCRGVEICLPHPFGCSCAPGFTGLDCQTVCDQGAYGAGCTEVCHCQSMSQCDSKTGLCSESGCERSWKGPMCQAKIFDVVGYGRPAAFQIGASFTVEGLTTLDMDTSVKLLIGRELDTGTGKTGSGMSHENANLTTMPSTSGLPAGTLQFTANGGHNSRLTLETMSSNYSHLGVYYVELINGKRRQHTQILRQSNNGGAVRFERFTLSVGTGESVTMTVSYYPPPSSTLRWRHNGREIPLANGNTQLTIDKARKADEGVYECFPENRDQSYKGFMILKVRACPSGFWGIYCNKTCPVCYYQGICHEETGQCVCQAGYYGDDCSKVCDDRSNAIGMTCDLNCTTRPELGSKCLYKQVCSPHPVGCHCRAGFGSVPKCNTECRHPYFGADCAMRANCGLTNYSAVSGCNASPCHQDYEGPGCQQLASYQRCPDGYHGRLCNYICHCADSINCNRWTGSCYGGECAEGWGGPNCQDALPALFDAPSFTVVEEGIRVFWNLWRAGYDYGTGPVDSYRVNFGSTNILTEQQDRTNEDTNNNYLTFTGLNLAGNYSISVSVMKIIQDEKTVGQSSPSVVACFSTTPPTNVNAEPTRAEENISFTVSWEDICPSTEFTYEVYFRPATGDGSDSVQTVQSERSVSITNGLLQCTEYLVSVKRNAEGSSRDRSAETTVLTDSEDPTAMPREVRATLIRGINPVRILVSWTPVNVTKLSLKCDPRTTDYTYEVYYEDAGNGNEHVIRTSSSSTNVTIANGTLSQCTEYLISVGIKNAVGRENRTSPVTVRTDSEDPTVAIYNVTAQRTGRVDQLLVSWSARYINKSDLKCDPYTGYAFEVYYHPRYETRAQNISTRGSQRSLTISNLQLCTEYSISVRIRNAIGRKNRATEPIFVRTNSEEPTTHIEFNISRLNDTNSGQIQVTWTTDAVSFENLKCDPSLGYAVIVRYRESTGNMQNEFVTAEGMNIHTLSNLRMCTEYAVSVVIRNIVDRESQSNVIKHVITDSEDVKVTPNNVYTSDVSQTSIELSWQPPESLDYISMGCYPKYPYKYEISYRSQHFSSVATILDQSQQEYKFTDLEPGSSYIFYLRLTNYAGRSGRYAIIECNTTVTADVLPFVLGVTCPSVFLILSLLVLVVYLIASPSRRSNLLSILSNKYWAIRRERVQDDNGFIEEEHSEMRTFKRDQQIPNVCRSGGKTIRRHELPSYVKEQHLKGGFHDEYKELIQGKYKSCSVAEAKNNERKNRFKNIVTYDHSRVVLPLVNGDSSSDYINASYIHGYKKQNAFIASQGPNKASFHDFWRMIWHEKCTKIIMVTLPVENGKMKCLTYWPDTDGAPQQYSNISVEKTGETASINLIIRRFKLQLGPSIHEVTQYHYFGWPDMKVLQSADILWDIIDEVEKDEDENSPPIVVHCSAGCGWTGTVIALASLRKMMKQEEAIAVFNFVNNMRKQRPLMVQVVEQYQFIFESLLINSYVGKPSTPVDDFHVNLRKWKAVTSLHKQTGLQRQFNMLSFVSPFPEDSENLVGLLSENIVKNRYPVIIPRNKFRPSLVTFVEDKTATDYINASFCDGYSKKDLFISTQLPLPNTIVDFWRMVIDYEVATIVTFEEHQTWLNYLPSEGAYQYGPFSVRVMELTQEDDITTRVLRISMDHSTYQNKKGLRMWITNISLSSPSLSSFVSLLEKTQAVQRQNENRRIVVQCLDGVSQCGMFMAVYNCCTGIIVDKVIDLFTMVRKLRERRPEMVGTLEQYEFCTQAISRKLSTSHVYANE